MSKRNRAGSGDGTGTSPLDTGHERVSLPSDDSLWSAGIDHASKRAAATLDPVATAPLYLSWIVEKGRVLADLRGAAWSAAHREELTPLARSTAATSAATATRTETTAAARGNQREVDELHAAQRPAGAGLPFLPRLPMVPYIIFLIGVAIGETAFNVTAFRITGEKEWFVGIMATLVGIASAMSAHLIGGPLEELTTTNPDRRGRIFVRLGVGAALALFMIGGLIAVAHLRADYLDVAQKGAASTGGATDTIATSDGGGADALPQIGLIAPLALNLMVWVVAIGAAYSHASVHHSAHGKMGRRTKRAAKHNRKARTTQANAMAHQISGHEAAAHATRAALADVESLKDLVNAKALLYAAAYCSVLDQHGITHFVIDDIPKLELPTWAADAKKLLIGHESSRDDQLADLNEQFVRDTTSNGSPETEAVDNEADPTQPTHIRASDAAA